MLPGCILHYSHIHCSHMHYSQCVCVPAAPFLQAYDDVEHFETPYVVKLFKFTPLAPPQVGLHHCCVPALHKRL